MRTKNIKIHGCKKGEEFVNEIDKMCGEYYGTAARAFIKGLAEYPIGNSHKDLRFAMEDFVADNAKACDG